jgi:hypothetical protein
VLRHPSRTLLEANEEVQRLLFKAQVDANELTGEADPVALLIDFGSTAYANDDNNYEGLTGCGKRHLDAENSQIHHYVEPGINDLQGFATPIWHAQGLFPQPARADANPKRDIPRTHRFAFRSCRREAGGERGDIRVERSARAGGIRRSADSW